MVRHTDSKQNTGKVTEKTAKTDAALPMSEWAEDNIENMDIEEVEDIIAHEAALAEQKGVHQGP